MKQMNDTHSDIDARPSRPGLFSIAAVCLSVMVSSTAMAQDTSDPENDAKVRAMYGIVYQQSTTASNENGEDIIDLSRSRYGSTYYKRKSNRADYSSFLSNSDYQEKYLKSPSFAIAHINAMLN